MSLKYETSLTGVLIERGISGSGYLNIGIISSLWTPLELFKSGEQGAWYDPSDLTTLFQDAAGTVAVESDGDPVGYMGDKSGNGNHATQSVSASRPVYRTDGSLHWLEFDGFDDFIVSAYSSGTSQSVYIAARGDEDDGVVIGASTSGDYRWFIQHSSTGQIRVGATATNTVLTGLSMATAPRIVGIEISTASPFAVEIDGVIIEQGTSGDVSGFPYTIGGGYGSVLCGCDFYGAFVVGRLLNNNEKTDATDYLSSKAGVTL